MWFAFFRLDRPVFPCCDVTVSFQPRNIFGGKKKKKKKSHANCAREVLVYAYAAKHVEKVFRDINFPVSCWNTWRAERRILTRR